MKRKFGYFIGMICCWLCSICIVCAATEQILCTKTHNEHINVFVNNYKEDYSNAKIQIGTEEVDNFEILTSKDGEVEVKTMILVDNSNSCLGANKEAICEILDGIIMNADENEEFRIGTFSKHIDWCSDGFFTDKAVLKVLLKDIEVSNQETFLSDCLYELVMEMEKSTTDCYERIIVVTDGADNKSIGYTNTEMLSLLEKSSVPVYAIGTPGDNAALETLFSFSRGSSADYYLIGDSKSGEEIANEVEAAADITCFRIYPNDNLLDGSKKSIKVSLGGQSLTTEAIMPFLDNGTNVKQNENVSNSEENAEETLVSSEEGNVAESNEDNQKTTNVQSIFGKKQLLVGGVSLVGIVLIAVGIIFVKKKGNGNSKVKSKKDNEPSNDTVLVEPTVSLCEETNETVSFFDGTTEIQDMFDTKYLLRMRDKDSLEHEFEHRFDEKVTIGRNTSGDILISYDSSISNPHCEIGQNEDGFYVRDLESLNGTKLNGKKISTDPTAINEGDELKLGRIKLEIVDLRQE